MEKKILFKTIRFHASKFCGSHCLTRRDFPEKLFLKSTTQHIVKKRQIK